MPSAASHSRGRYRRPRRASSPTSRADVRDLHGHAQVAGAGEHRRIARTHDDGHHGADGPGHARGVRIEVGQRFVAPAFEVPGEALEQRGGKFTRNGAARHDFGEGAVRGDWQRLARVDQVEPRVQRRAVRRRRPRRDRRRRRPAGRTRTARSRHGACPPGARMKPPGTSWTRRAGASRTPHDQRVLRVSRPAVTAASRGLSLFEGGKTISCVGRICPSPTERV